ncbi:uncharacterized protein LOC123562048 [Mercenaria mercenaria]|uniref:uncharacterized protein LOC123562048 n=1 Tax=Mercenaria mercenaria TaxID=6596 RepID=UPI00234E3A77|nr:uncharacterized protein LOC123562048 [Mercenaria mercenaria]
MSTVDEGIALPAKLTSNGRVMEGQTKILNMLHEHFKKTAFVESDFTNLKDFIDNRWSEGYVIPLHKKGSINDVTWAENNRIYIEAQAGFRADMSTVDNIFVACGLESAANELQDSINLLQQYCNEWKLRVAITKTNIMIFRKGGLVSRYVPGFRTSKYRECKENDQVPHALLKSLLLLKPSTLLLKPSMMQYAVVPAYLLKPSMLQYTMMPDLCDGASPSAQTINAAVSCGASPFAQTINAAVSGGVSPYAQIINAAVSGGASPSAQTINAAVSGGASPSVQTINAAVSGASTYAQTINAAVSSGASPSAQTINAAVSGASTSAHSFNAAVHRKNSSSLIDKLVKWTGFVLLITSTSLPTIQTTPICYGKIDIIFVIDASYSIRPEDFTKVLEFVSELYSKIFVDVEDKLRAGVIPYASSVYEGDQQISLSGDQSKIKTMLATFTRDNGNIRTNTGAALGEAYKMFTEEGRSDAKKILFLVTDGRADDLEVMNTNARNIKGIGAHAVAIGIGEKVDRTELNTIASSVDSVYIFTEITEELKTKIQKDICGQTLDSKVPPTVEKDDVQMDIYFLLDEAILPQDLDISKRFMKNILQTFVIGQGKARASVFLYGASTGQNFAVDVYTTETTLFNGIDRLSLTAANNDERNVANIFTTVAARITSSSTSGPVIVVLFLTGSVENSALAIQKANVFRESSGPRIYLMVIGIGASTEALTSEQNRLAYDVGTAFQAENFLRLAGEDQASIDLVSDIRKTIFQLASGTYVTIGGISYRWESMFDVVFMIDGSSKMSQSFNHLVVKFVMKELIDEFELGPEKGRVAVLVFDAAGVYNIIRFGTYNDDHATLNTRIDNLQLIQRVDTVDNTIGLKAMLRYFLDNNRESASKLGYLITLGQARNKLLAEAEARALALEGIQLMVIGIGSGVSADELNNYQMFDRVDGPVLISPIATLASTQNLRELKDDLLKYATISRPRGLYFQWDAAFDLIVLVHDESGRADGGARVKYFLQDIFHRYPIGVNDVLGGVITFGKDVNTGTGKEIALGTDKFYSALYVKIAQLDLTPTGGTNMLAALGYLTTMFSLHGRPDVAKVALLLMQGDVVLDDLHEGIQKVRDAGIAMATVGVGPETDMVDLKNMAYNSEAELAFLQTSWQMLRFTPEMDAALIALARGNFQAQGIGDILRLPTQCSGNAGILFILDASESITSIFDDVKAFTAAIMSGFTMPEVDMGALAFANIVLPNHIALGQYKTYVELYAHFMENININPTYKTTGTAAAVNKMVELFDPSAKEKKIAVLLTDGNSDESSETTKEARKAREAGIDMIVIGIGSNIFEDELDTITAKKTTGGVPHKFIFSTSDLTDPSKLEDVQNLICTLIRPGECPAGSFRDPVSLVCSVCPVGTYQPLSEQLFCKTCTLGYTTSDPGASMASQCIQRCNAGYYLDLTSGTGTCKNCPIGQYQPKSGQTMCLVCDPATPITKFEGSRSVDDCILDTCSIPMDLIFVVDATASIGVIEFSMLKAFLINQLERFDIGSTVDKTQISVVRIGTVTKTTDVTNFLTTRTSVIEAIRDLVGGDLSTNIASAIEMASNKFESDGRSNMAKVMFIVTDGNSENPYATRYQALLAKQKYQIVVLGIGSQYFMPELKSLASVPENILTEKNFFELPALDAYTTICKAAARWTAPTVTVAPAFKCDLKLDLILIMDMSSSLTSQPFEVMMMKARLREFIDLLQISSSKVNVGVLSFGEDVNTNQRLQLSADNDKDAIKNAIMMQQPAGDGTVTHLALNEAKTMLQSSQRTDAAKAITIVTDGRSTNYAATVAAAKEVEKSGIYAVAVGKGSPNDEAFKKELGVISTSGSDTTVFVDTLRDLTGEKLETKVCPENFRCSYTLQVVYIWYLNGNVAVLDKTTKFSADVSERFSDVQARVIEVKADTTIDTLLKAVTEAEKQMNEEQSSETIHNFVYITNRPPSDVGSDMAELNTKTAALKQAGVKITIVDARDTQDTGWEQYATSSETVFRGANFDEAVPAWYIHRSLCKEPCDSGYEIGADGRCKVCDVGKYRDKTESYLCQACSADSTTESTGSTSVADCTIKIRCEKPMDLIFVIDATASIGNNYNILKAFFWSLVDKFQVGLDDETRVAVVKIGDGDLQDDDFSLLSQSVNAIAVKESIIRLQGNEQETDTAASLKKVYDIFKAEGRPQKDYPHIVLVATDGKSKNTLQTKRYSSILKLNAIHTLVIRLGDNVFQPEIDALAYDASSVYKFDTYTDLIQSNYIHERICDAAKNYKPLQPDTGGPELSGKCKSYMDMVFVIDASLSVTELTFLKMRIFIAQFAQMLDIGQEKIRIGIVAFSSTVHSEVFSLEQCLDQKTLEVNGIQPQKRNSVGNTNTAAGLARMIDMFTTEGRPDSPYIGIIVTDGRSTNPTLTKLEAQKAKDKGIHIVAVGFGDNVYTQELYDMATDPASVKVVSSFDDLTTEELLDLSCSYNFECPHKMDIIAIWDLVNFDTIRRAEIYIESLKKSFLYSKITNLFVDHVDDVAIAMEEGLQSHTSRTDFRVARVILVLTDKVLDTDVKGRLQTVATNAKNAGILVTVVDAATTTNNIASIASNDKLSFVTERFDMLPYRLVLKRSLCTEPCKSGTEVSAGSTNPGSCEPCAVNKYRDADESFLCTTCPTGRTTDGATASDQLSDCLFGFCRAPMDVVFVVDSSDSIRTIEYTLMKVFLLNTIGSMDISEDRTRVGILPYSSEILVEHLFQLQESTQQETVLQAVRSMTQGGLPTGTNTARAIDVAKNMLLTQGRRTGDVIQMICVITDGMSTNTYRTVEEAKKAKDKFIRLYSLGVGPNVFATELEKIASDMDSIMMVNDFFKLAAIKDFTKTICEDSFTCGKTMDVVIFEDRTTVDATFGNRFNNFKAKMTSSYSSATVTSASYTSMAELDTLVQSQDLSQNPQNTKVFLFITKTDIADDGAKSRIASELRSGGGIVAIINADDNLGNTNFITIASSLEFIFNVENFDELPAYRFIERKLCIDPCLDGEQRGLDGECEKCPRGKYRVKTSSHICESCAGDKTTLNTGTTEASDCIPNCGPGYKTVGDNCVECAKGEYQTDSFQTNCESCDAGYTTVETKSTSPDQCIKNCDEGEKVSSTDKDTCVVCEENTYQPEKAQTHCIDCPINLFSIAGSAALDDCNDACGKAMDIIFLVDASLSLSPISFQLIKVFVGNSITRFKVSQTATRIGIIQFSDIAAVSPRLDLDQSLDRFTATSLARALIRSGQPGTNTAAALDAAVKMFDDQGRTDIHKNIVVVTDGMSTNMALTEAAAAKAKKKFINIISIGVGNNFFLDELKKIATDESAVKTFTSFYSLINFNVLPIVCTPTQFSCDKNMDIFYIKHYDGNSGIEARVAKFISKLTDRYKTGTTKTLVDANPSTESLTDDLTAFSDSADPTHTKVLIIFTNKENSGGVTANDVKDKGVIVAVVYVSDTQTDESYNTVVSHQDFLFYAEKFDEEPYIDFILRSLCIAPCVDGSERTVSGDCEECEKGKYRTASSSHVCVDCPSSPQQTTTAGTGATDQSQCVACESDEFPCSTGNTCIDEAQVCDGSNDCSDGSDEICNNCLKGSRWTGSTCVQCERGTFQDKDGQTVCIKCPEGKTTDGVGKTAEADCTVVCDESGQELDYPNGGCRDCEIGYYRNKDFDAICVKCDDDFTTKQKASTSKGDCVPPCQAGEALDDATKTCTDCPYGTYQPEPNQYKCLDCPDGTTTQSVKSTQKTDCQDPCPAGKEHPAGSTSNTACTDCPRDTYKSSQDTTCKPCPPGFITLNIGSKTSADCLPNCDLGTYFDDSLKKCEECTFGQYQDQKYQKTCKDCDTGKTTRNQGSDDITDCIVPCPAGSYLPFRLNGQCTPCPQGTYRVDDETAATCTPCGSGKTTDQEGSTSVADCKPDCKPGEKIEGDICVLCEIGSYQTLPRQTSCNLCADYTTTKEEGTDSPDDCVDTCPSGTELTEKNPVKCQKCAMNSYKEAGVDKKCTACPANHITLSDGAVSKTECVPDCTDGQKWDAVTLQCEACEAGTFQPWFYKDTCIKCRDKWTTLAEGAKKESDCKPDCTAGEHWDEASLSCVKCNKDSYQPNPYQFVCLKCPEGTFTDNTGAVAESECKDQCQLGEEMGPGGTSPSDCVKCKVGTYKDATKATCEPCPDGLTTLTDGKTASTDCKPACEAGQQWDSDLKLCVACEAGTYQDETNQEDCKQCMPLGFTTLQTGSTDETDCVSPCAPGSAWDSGLGRCKPCLQGKYQDEPNQKECKQCPSGRTTLGEGSKNENDCIDVNCSNLEWKCDNGDCIPEVNRCDGSNDCADLSDESDTKCCNIGQFYSYTTNQCESCRAGTYQDIEGETSCIDCPKGMTSEEGSDASNDCRECLEGFEFIVGNTDCTECPLDKYREIGMMTCEACPPNFGTDQTGTTRLTDCKPKCTAGQYYDSGQFQCEPCPVGQYQDQAKQTECIKCPTGTTTSGTGSINSNQCTDICQAGYTLVYDTNGEPTTNCNPCPVSTYKDTYTCKPCPTGFTTAGTGSTECLPNCGPGYFYPSKTSPVCKKCARGEYQTESLQPSCDSCPPGQTTPILGATTSFLCYGKSLLLSFLLA